jgi:hypothetical protein
MSDYTGCVQQYQKYRYTYTYISIHLSSPDFQMPKRKREKRLAGASLLKQTVSTLLITWFQFNPNSSLLILKEDY